MKWIMKFCWVILVFWFVVVVVLMIIVLFMVDFVCEKGELKLFDGYLLLLVMEM